MVEMKKMSNISLARSQQGMALFMSLVMLLIITVLGLSSVQTTILQERMARNFRDVNLAFQSTESAIKVAKSLSKPSIALTIFGAAGARLITKSTTTSQATHPRLTGAEQTVTSQPDVDMRCCCAIKIHCNDSEYL
jgi:Tfp pilus assembly protein PilX